MSVLFPLMKILQNEDIFSIFQEFRNSFTSMAYLGWSKWF